jgi:hypothetical protein
MGCFHSSEYRETVRYVKRLHFPSALSRVTRTTCSFRRSLVGRLVPEWDMEALISVCKIEKPSLLRSQVNLSNKLFIIVVSGEVANSAATSLVCNSIPILFRSMSTCRRRGRAAISFRGQNLLLQRL